MSDYILKRFEELLEAGNELAPQGGFDYSGYNARLQSTYLEWRKACLEILELSGPIGIPYKNKILGDLNGGFFYQISALLILHSIHELYVKLKASPETASGSAKLEEVKQAPVESEWNGVRVLKPPAKKEKKEEPENAEPTSLQTVYTIGEKDNPLYVQLSLFLSEIGISEILIERRHGAMISIDELKDRNDVRFAYFVLSEEDLAYAMFEIGQCAARFGPGHVCVLCRSDMNFPEKIPGVDVQRIVIKLEEAGLGLIKGLKAAGYTVKF
jgi:hypothetical protein